MSEPLYDAVCAELERLGARVERGRFGADMRVESVVATALMRSSTDVLAVVDDDGGLIGIVTATDIRRVVERTALGLPAQRRTPGGLRPVSSGPGRS